MFIHELVGGETNPVYQDLSVENLDRQYAFLRSLVLASAALKRPILSIEVIKALNYHAISVLHPYAGEFRPCPVEVGDYKPPPHYLVPGLMNMFVDEVNRYWDSTDPVQLCAYVLWRLNQIHPFVNGNGRAARASCYYVLCLKLGGWLAGSPILPALIKANRGGYVSALKVADSSAAAGKLDLGELHALISNLLNVQTGGGSFKPSSATPSGDGNPPDPH